jgi:hypothetical protein
MECARHMLQKTAHYHTFALELPRHAITLPERF